jgi:hypothetical protein
MSSPLEVIHDILDRRFARCFKAVNAETVIVAVRHELIAAFFTARQIVAFVLGAHSYFSDD